MKDELGSNVPPSRTPKGWVGHWVEYDLDINAQPIKSIKTGDQQYYGQLTKRFDTQFEAVMWLKGYELQGRYLGYGYLDQVKNAFRQNKLIGEQE
jgi:hypothetical protein